MLNRTEKTMTCIALIMPQRNCRDWETRMLIALDALSVLTNTFIVEIISSIIFSSYADPTCRGTFCNEEVKSVCLPFVLLTKASGLRILKRILSVCL